MKVLVTLAVVLLIANAAEAKDSKHCLAEAMYFEARDQGWRGMLAVGVVIQNRVRDPRYPDDACGVVRQGRYWRGNPIKHKCQFSYYCDGTPERPAEKEPGAIALDLAGILLSGHLVIDGLGDATHYHTTTVRPGWSRKLSFRRVIGDHVFYAR